VISEGSLVAPAGARFAIAASRFNEAIVRRLVEGAIEQFVRSGVDRGAVDVAWCPGAFELPLVSRRFAESARYAAVVALGCVIRGDTDHYEYVSRAAADGILRASLDTGVPVMFGVLTVDTVEQAMERAGADTNNKGAEAAAGAVEMAHLLAGL
jgi:6,7-dimethyl-8-ribityllumazine synthase